MEEAKRQAGETAKTEREEITIKFAKKLLGEPFKGKDGTEYRQVSIPNQDPQDKSPWRTFVIRAQAAKDDKFNDKLVYIKLPKEGYTTVKKRQHVGTTQTGQKEYIENATKLSNMELKEAVEFYKTRGREPETKEAGYVPIEKSPFDEEPPRSSLKLTVERAKETVETKKAERPKSASHSKKKEQSL